MSQGRRGIDRAFKHAQQQLDACLQQLDDHLRGPFLTAEPIPNSLNIRVAGIVQPPEDLAFLIQDAVHYTRCGLDYLAGRLVEVGGGTPNRDTFFPIGTKVAGYAVKVRKSLAGAKQEHIDAVLALKAHPGGDESFVLLSDIDNNYKHRMLPVAWIALPPLTVSLSVGESKDSLEFAGKVNLGDIPGFGLSILRVGEVISPSQSHETGSDEFGLVMRTSWEQQIDGGLQLTNPDRVIAVRQVVEVIGSVMKSVESLIDDVA